MMTAQAIWGEGAGNIGATEKKWRVPGE